MSAKQDDTIDTIERAIIQLARDLGRRNIGRWMERNLENLVNASHLAVVDTLCELGADGASVTVGRIGRRIGVDPSRASRMVAETIRAGYIRRVASQEDGRRACLALTDAGKDYAESIRRLRRKYFASHLRHWPETERKEFARLLSRFTKSINPLDGTDSIGEGAASPGSAVILMHPARRKQLRQRRQ